MTQDKKTLQVFGFGLSILIPYLILMHGLKLGFMTALGGLIVLLIVISKVDKLRILYYLLLAGIYALFIKSGQVNKMGTGSYILLLASYLILVISAFKVEWLAPVYKKWMQIAQLFGALISGIVLTLVFFLVFTIVGIILRLMGKDLLARKIETEKKSYWIKRPKEEFTEARYTRQF